MSVGGIVDRAVALYRQWWRPFALRFVLMNAAFTAAALSATGGSSISATGASMVALRR